MTRLMASVRSLVVVAAGLIIVASQSALPVVLDIRVAQLVLCLAATLLLAVAIFSARTPTRRVLVFGLTVFMAAFAVVAWRDLTLGSVEEVEFSSAGLTLRGSLFLPSGPGPYPAVVLVHGAGQQTRDEYSYYARQYARRGIAALAYDKRGSGLSGGLEEVSYQALADDVVAAVGALRMRADVDPSRVGIWGLSEGEWVGPLAAAASKPAFLVLVSAAVMTPAEQVRYETGANVRAAGFSEDDARQAAELYARVSAFERTGEGREELNRLLAAASAKPWFEAAQTLEASVPPYDRVRALPWFPAWRARMDFDALPLIARLTCPVLAQIGGADPKNDGAAANERIRAAMAAGGNTRFTGFTYPNAEHNLIEWRLPFRLPMPFFARGYLGEQLAWVEDQVKSSED